MIWNKLEKGYAMTEAGNYIGTPFMLSENIIIFETYQNGIKYENWFTA